MLIIWGSDQCRFANSQWIDIKVKRQWYTNTHVRLTAVVTRLSFRKTATPQRRNDYTYAYTVYMHTNWSAYSNEPNGTVDISLTWNRRHPAWISNHGPRLKLWSVNYIALSVLCQWYESSWTQCHPCMDVFVSWLSVIRSYRDHFLVFTVAQCVHWDFLRSYPLQTASPITVSRHWTYSRMVSFGKCCFVISILIVQHSCLFLLGNYFLARQFLSKTHLYGWCDIKLVTFFFVTLHFLSCSRVSLIVRVCMYEILNVASAYLDFIFVWVMCVYHSNVTFLIYTYIPLLCLHTSPAIAATICSIYN